MRKILIVMRREYRQSVKTKAFWIGTLAIPVAMALLFALSIGAQFINPEKQIGIAVMDQGGRLFEPLAAQLAEHRLKDDQPRFLLELVPGGENAKATQKTQEARVLHGELYALLMLGAELDSDPDFRLYRKNVGDEDTLRTLRSALSDVVIEQRLQSSDLPLDREVLDALVARVPLDSFQVTADGEAQEKGFGQVFIGPYVFTLLLYFVLYFWGYAMLRGVLQEKTNRVMEVLLGSLSPDQLMTGKILGLGLVGLTQVGVYAIVGGGLRIAVLAFTDNADLAVLMDALSLGKLVTFVVFFVLGYLMYTSLFAMVGAVCNSEQEAQSLQAPLIIMLMLPMMLTFFFVKHPDSTAAVVASLFPFFTPMVMFMRISTVAPPAWQVALSVLLMVGTIYVLFRAAAKVFRVGTLMYGKRPTLPEIWRWARD